MATLLRHIVLDKLETGLITDRNQMELPLGAATACNNVVWIDGYLRSRAGFGLSFLNPSGIYRIHAMGGHQNNSGTTNPWIISLNVGTGVGTFWYIDVYTHLNYHVFDFPVNEVYFGIPVTSCNFAGKTYIATGNGPVYVFDADLMTIVLLSSLSAAGHTPPDKPQIIAAGDSRLFVGNTYLGADHFAYHLEWCDRLLPQTWGGGVGGGSSYFMDLPKNSDAITGFYTSGSDVMVFRPRETYVLSFVGSPQGYKIQSSVRGPGCVAHATIKPYLLGEVVWLGDGNIYKGSPTTQPQAIGDHVRTRIREIVRTADLSKAKALLDVDTHLYTLFMPNISTGQVNKMFTINLLNGSWWEGVMDPALGNVTDTLSYRYGPWEMRHLVATDLGVVWEHNLSYSMDGSAEFQCSWTSGVITARGIYDPKVEQASAQSLRAMAERTTVGGLATEVNFSLLSGNGLDRFQSVVFGLTSQLLDGEALVYQCERTCAENFKISAFTDAGSKFPKIAQIHFGTIAEGVTR